MATNCDALIVPGPQGSAGAAGANGTNGTKAYSLITVPYTLPAIGATGQATVDDTEWMAPGQIVVIAQSTSIYAYVRVESVDPSGTLVTFFNLETATTYTGNAAGGTVFPIDIKIVAGGAEGPSGAAVTWADVDKTISSIADITTRSAAALSSGVLAHERGGLEVDAASFDGFVRIAAGATTEIKVNFAATTAPLVTDDSGSGYAIGSLWLDTTNDEAWMALDVSVGAAVWRRLSFKESTLDGDILNITWAPTVYTRSTAPVEVTAVTELTAHLAGIDLGLALVAQENGECRIETVSTTPTTIADNAHARRLILCDSTAGAITINLDPAANFHGALKGAELTFKEIAAAPLTVTLNPSGAENIDGAANYIIAANQYDAVTIVSDGTTWHVTNIQL